MARKPAQLAKLARPITNGLLERPRLFEVLDEACHKPTVWISAPAGAGKTSLVSSYLENRQLPCLWYQIDEGDSDLTTFFHYLGRAVQSLSLRKRPLPSLTQEYLADIETFTRRYFRLLFERLLPPSALVFDNFHEAFPDSHLHRILANALDEIPPGNNVYFISRYDPPPSLARSYSNAAVTDWAQIKLTAEESRGLLRYHGYDNPDAVQTLIDAAQGWAAGLVLLARTPDNVEIRFPSEPQQPQILYNYFAQEVFNKIPVPSHDILIKTALLPSVTPAAACALTGLTEAAEIIVSLHRERYFIDRHSQKGENYVYHPLFRAFLLHHGKQRYSEQELIRLKCQAAQILEKNGQIENAIDLYIETGSLEEADRLIVSQAPLFIEQGRNAVLNGWIDSFPVTLIEQKPWLLYWRGISRMSFNPSDSRASLEAAFNLFKTLNEVAGMYLTISSILTSYFYEWGDFNPVKKWLAELEILMFHHPEFPTIEVETRVAMGMIALVMYCPQHPLIKQFKQRAFELMHLCKTPQQRISVTSPAILYCLWSGEFNEAGRLIDELKLVLDMRRISPADLIAFKISESKYEWRRTAHAEALKIIVDARALACNTGVHVLDCQISAQLCWAALGAEDFNLVEKTLADAKAALNPTHRADGIVLHLIEYGLALLQETVSYVAVDVMRGVVEEAQKIATPYGEAETRILLSQLLIELGEHQAARSEFEWLKAFAKAMPSPYIEFRTQIIAANSAFLTGEETEGISYLRQALVLGREKGFINCHPGWQPKVMSRLFAKALEANLEVNYVQHFIRVRNLKAPSPDINNWPWPIKIFTLGHFSLLIDDQPLHFQGKAQKKPLELLKCLIANGGQGVSQNLLSNQLWPDLEGDAGRNAFDMAVHRLRKLLKNNCIIEVQDGKLSLDSHYVWVDAWAFDRLCTDLETEKNKDTLSKVAQRLLNLYRGYFLEGDDHSWLLARRERLNSKFTRNVSSLAQKLTSVDASDDVIALYRQAIEFDPLIEEFHRGLMQSYQMQGKISEALSAYRHCQDMLSIVLGIQPSQQTQAVYRSLKSP